MTSRKEYMREYQKNWIAQRRSDFFKDKVCAICGTDNRLELDHVDPTTKQYNPAALWGMSADNPKRIAEFAKCQVLCYDHHKEKTKQEKAESRQHGRTMYKYGCKCDICCEAQRMHNAQRKMTRPHGEKESRDLGKIE